MRAYLAECFWPDVTEEKAVDLLGRACAAAEQLGREGHDVRVTDSWLVPGDEVALLFIDAATLEEAGAVGVRGNVPFERIVEVRRRGASGRVPGTGAVRSG
jgi:hypothetical protein